MSTRKFGGQTQSCNFPCLHPEGTTNEDTSFIQPNSDHDVTTRPAPQYTSQIDDLKMGPVGSWAGGHLNYAPLAGLTGTRPVVDRHSITRFSVPDWLTRNANLAKNGADTLHQSSICALDVQQNIETVRNETDRVQQEVTRRLHERSQDILRWKSELERAITAISDEINDLEQERARLKQAEAVLTLPEMIVGETLDLRTGRIEIELVRDEAEDELMKEYALIYEIREVFNRTLESVNQQLIENKTAKTRLEFDWSDKSHACEIDLINGGLRNKSNIILFKPGATRFNKEQSTPEHWDEFTRRAIDHSERTILKSFALRQSLNSILTNAARDLRSQADRVENALLNKSNCVAELIDDLEEQLRQVLKAIADMEVKSNETDALLRQLDMPMKVAQTRLDNRTLRMGVEDCRDPVQYGLIEEIKQISRHITSLKVNHDENNRIVADLIKQRGELERNIMILRKTLAIDRERIGKLRTFYPTMTALMGRG